MEGVYKMSTRVEVPRLKLTKKTIEALPFTTDKPAYYRDTELPGFGLYVGRNSKNYFVEGRGKEGNKHRAVIGPHNLYSPETARLEARRWLLQIYEGHNPSRKHSAGAAGLTLTRIFDQYISSRQLSPVSLGDYRRIMDKDISSWADMPIWRITKEMIGKQYTSLGEKSHAQANLSMRLLRALFNFASAEYEGHEHMDQVMTNPVSRLFKSRQWFPIQRKKTVIRSHEIGPWIKAVINLDKIQQDTTTRDYLLLLLLTGLRRTEAATLKKANVDIAGKLLTVRDTKNGDDHTLPLPDFLVSILKPHVETGESPYVFPGTGKTGYLVEPRKMKAHVTKISGVKFTLHDLRRTFITVAESLDIPAYALKRLLNHKMTNDVTAGYIIADPERLRGPMNKICDYMLGKADSSITAQGS